MMRHSNFNEDFINEFTQLIEIDKKDFNEQQDLSGYTHWDSLAVVSMIALVDQYFGVKIQGKEIEACRTLEDIFLQIKNKKH